jgi:hypothetical protein
LDGGVRDPDGFPVVTAPGYQGGATLAFNGSQYLIAWTDIRNNLQTGRWDVYAARLLPDGEVLDDGGVLIDPAGSEDVELTAASDGVGFLLGWRDYTPDQGSIWVRAVSVQGGIGVGARVPVVTEPRIQSTPSLAFDGLEYAIAWEDDNGPAFQIRAMHLQGDGTPVPDSGVHFTGAPGGQQNPALAAAGPGRILAVYSEYDNASAVRTMRARSRLWLDLPLGSTCSGSAECRTGLCSSGRCCEQTCDGGACVTVCSADPDAGQSGSPLSLRLSCSGAPGGADISGVVLSMLLALSVHRVTKRYRARRLSSLRSSAPAARPRLCRRPARSRGPS